MVKGKNVIIVGPAGYLQGQGRGKEFDSYDVVVRLNQSRPISDDYGSRTDILYCFATEMDAEYYNDPEKFVQDGVKIINITHSVPPWCNKLKKTFLEENKKLRYKGLKIHINGPDEKFYKQVYSECGTKPNTGTVAMAHLLKSSVKSLTVVGIDMFSTKHYDGYSTRGVGAHDFDKQMYYISQLAYINGKQGRMFIDDHLQTRIENTCRITDNKRIKLPKMSLLMPYKATGCIRDDIFKFSVKRYEKVFPEFEICVGETTDTPFNRSKAINLAAQKATRDIFCIVDTDALFGRDFVKKAMSVYNGWVTMTGRSWRLSKKVTKELVHTPLPLKDVGLSPIIGLDNIRFFMLISRDRFFGGNGFDETFQNWGGEDFAFWQTQQILFGSPSTLPSHVFHLWHPQSPHKKIHMAAFRSKKLGIADTYDRHYLYSKAKTKEDIFKLIRGRNTY